MAEYKQTEHSMRKWGEKQKMAMGKLDREEELQRKNNILILGMEERENENYLDTKESVMKFLKDV
jgi:hypothetical protein